MYDCRLGKITSMKSQHGLGFEPYGVYILNDRGEIYYCSADKIVPLFVCPQNPARSIDAMACRNSLSVVTHNDQLMYIKLDDGTQSQPIPHIKHVGSYFAIMTDGTSMQINKDS